MSLIFFFLISLALSVSALYEFCDYYEELVPGEQRLIFSPGYPYRYKGAVSCRWYAVAPQGMEVFIVCQNASIPYSPSCTMDRLAISRTGDVNLFGADNYCGSGSFTSVSLGNKMNIAFTASPFTPGGIFLCSIGVQEGDEPEQDDCECGWKNQNRIVGGTETGVNEFPMMAGLVDGELRKLYCGATIIGQRYAVTAAHCLINRNPKKIALLIGDHDISTGNDTKSARLIVLEKTIIHPQYNSQTNENDIAVVRVPNPIEFNMKVGPACLPFRNQRQTFVGYSVDALGWGSNEYGGAPVNALQKVSLNIVSEAQCRATYGNKVSNKQICSYAENKDACQSDSGGPLLWKEPETGRVKILGIISYGIQCATNNPSVNTRVSSYLSWILSVTDDEDYCVK